MIESHALPTFARDGYVVIPNVVDADRVEGALRIANHWLDTGFDSTQRDSYHSKSFAPEHTGDPEMLGLLTDTPAFGLAEHLVGQSLAPPTNSQITMRFPAEPGRPPEPFGAHLDGLPTPLNGVPFDGRVHGFTALAAVLLSDCPAGEHGNFTVWPGTHLEMARWFRADGTRVPDVDAFVTAVRDLADATSEPVSVVGRAGDLVLAHYLLLHGTGIHTGPHVRYVVFFRLKTPHYLDLGDAPLTDPWLEWPAFPPGDRPG